MVLLLDPRGAMRQLLRGEQRADQEIVDYLDANQFRYFDMNEVHAADYRNFNLGIPAYYNRYFIGHYNPMGNHFSVYSLAPRVIDWLEPKSVTYRQNSVQSINFKDYL